MTSISLDIRPFTPADYDDVFDLYERAWPGDVTRRKTAFRWLHEGNPFSDPERSYVLAYKGGRLAGYWGRMPMRFRHHGVPIDCVFAQEALVDPAFRRQGIARRLMEEATSAPELYLSLWHNEKIVSLLQSSGWSSMGRYYPRKKIYRATAVLRWKLGNPCLARLLGFPARLLLRDRHDRLEETETVTIESVDYFTAEMDAFFDRVAPEFAFIADRNSVTLNWRFSHIPHRTFQRFVARDRTNRTVRGYLVTEITDLPKEGLLRGDIVDFLVSPQDPSGWSALLREADRCFRRRGVDFAVVLHTLPHYGAIANSWRFRRTWKARPGNQLLFLDRREQVQRSEGHSYSQWFLTQGDSDGHLW